MAPCPSRARVLGRALIPLGPGVPSDTNSTATPALSHTPAGATSLQQGLRGRVQRRFCGRNEARLPCACGLPHSERREVPALWAELGASRYRKGYAQRFQDGPKCQACERAF